MSFVLPYHRLHALDRQSLTSVTSCDHTGHNHNPFRTIAVPVAHTIMSSSTHSPMSSSSLFVLPNSSVTNDTLISATPSANIQESVDFPPAFDDEIVIGSIPDADTDEDQECTTILNNNSAFPVLITGDEATVNLNGASSFPHSLCHETNDILIPSASPSSELMLEEEIVPFFDQMISDNVFIDLDIPTIYGIHAPSSRNYDTFSFFNNVQQSLEEEIPNGQVDPYATSQKRCNGSSVWIRDKETRDSVFRTLLQTISDKVQLMEAKTGALTSFVLMYGNETFSEKNVGRFIFNGYTEGTDDPLQLKYPLLFGKNSEQAASSAIKSTTTNAVEISEENQDKRGRRIITGIRYGIQSDDEYDEQSFTLDESETELHQETEDRQDHLYAATLVRQKKSSPTVQDHQYVEVASTGKGKTKMKSAVKIRNGNTDKQAPKECEVSPNLGTVGTNHVPSQSFIQDDYFRHRRLTFLVEALMDKVTELEDKTGALLLALITKYESYEIRPDNYKTVLRELTGVVEETTTLEIERPEDQTHNEVLEIRKNGSFRRRKSSPEKKAKKKGSYACIDRRRTVQPLNKSQIQLIKCTGHSGGSGSTRNDNNMIVRVKLPNAGSSRFQPGSGDMSSNTAQHNEDQSIWFNNTESMLNSSSGLPSSRSNQSSRTNSPTTVSDSSTYSQSRGPVCGKCSQSIPPAVSNNTRLTTTKWIWLRCNNPLCFYMVHSSCLGFYTNGNTIDLNQFTFPPFYCKQHRLK